MAEAKISKMMSLIRLFHRRIVPKVEEEEEIDLTLDRAPAA